MKLIFYFMTHYGQEVSFTTEEREARPCLRDKKDENSEVLGYEFDPIRDHGRPFGYIKKKAVGEVFADVYHSLMLVLEEKDRDRAGVIWSGYFDSTIAEKKNEISRLTEEKEAAKKSDAFKISTGKRRTVWIEDLRLDYSFVVITDAPQEFIKKVTENVKPNEHSLCTWDNSIKGTGYYSRVLFNSVLEDMEDLEAIDPVERYYIGIR